jgi:hypothetical protein
MAHGAGKPRVGINGILDQRGFSIEASATGELKTVVPIDLIGDVFEGSTLDPNFWIATVANSATVTQGSGLAVLTSGTDAAGAARMHSFRRALFVPGLSNRYRSLTVLGDTGVANNVRKWGVGFGTSLPTITDGAYFKLSGTTFSIVTLKNSSETVVNSGSFNGSVSSYSLDTNIHEFEILWTNRAVYFLVDEVLIHTVSATTTTWSGSVEFHTYSENVNSGNTTSVTMSHLVIGVKRFGSNASVPRYFHQAGTTAGQVLKYSSGVLHEITVSGVSNNSVITLYDNFAASGSIIWTSGSMPSNSVPFYIDLRLVRFYIGLTLVIATADSTVTVLYE